MGRYRSILACILALLMSLTIATTSAMAVKTPSYSPAQIEQIQRFVPEVKAMRDRFGELQAAIQKQKWTDARDFIHGPLGQLRRDLAYIERNLLPPDKAAANEAAKSLYVHLINLDRAALDANYAQAVKHFKDATKDFDAFLQLIPS